MYGFCIIDLTCLLSLMLSYAIRAPCLTQYFPLSYPSVVWTFQILSYLGAIAKEWYSLGIPNLPKSAHVQNFRICLCSAEVFAEKQNPDLSYSLLSTQLFNSENFHPPKGILYAKLILLDSFFSFLCP